MALINLAEQVLSTSFINGWAATAAQLYHQAENLLNSYISGPQSLKLISVGLMILSLILFLFIIIVLYIKSIATLIRSGDTSDKTAAADRVDPEDVMDELTTEARLERELEILLEKELEQAQSEKAALQKSQQQFQQNLEERNREEEDRKAVLEKKKKDKENLVDLDWKKGKEPKTAGQQASQALSYQKEAHSLNELAGLIMDMISRGVDDAKIAQTINFRNQGLAAEEDILQTVNAVKSFIALCFAGKFKNLQSDKKLPDIDEALFHLAKGDPSLALALIEARMDNDIEKSMIVTSEDIRDQIFAEVSQYAIIFGTLAELTNVNLAMSSYELAIELVPQNLTAWSRIGDIYHKTGSIQNAIDAYRKVLSNASPEFESEILANAKQKISAFLAEQGKQLEATRLYNESQQYYNSLGINARLDKQELEIVELIESRKNNDIESMIGQITALHQKEQNMLER